jgi:hypothetical protein
VEEVTIDSMNVFDLPMEGSDNNNEVCLDASDAAVHLHMNTMWTLVSSP